MNILDILYGPVIFFTKLSILLQFLRMFVPKQKNWAYYYIVFLIWFNLLFYTAMMFSQIFGCTSQEKTWNEGVEGLCLNDLSIQVASAAVNVLSDFLILLMPFPCIWQLQLPVRRKIGISAIFAFGSL